MRSLEDLEKDIKSIAASYTAEPIGGWITGHGPVPAKVLFVGEAPGKTEVELGMPFVGMAGKTFESYLKSIGLTRNDIRITNACYFRPIKLNTSHSGRTTVSNRPPKASEVALFKDILDNEIHLVNPKVIVTLGNIPIKRLTSFKSIGDCHGKLYYNENLKSNVFPMYHPSSLTYNRDEHFLETYEEDWIKLKEALETL